MAKTIQDYKNDYAAAQAKGDKAGMAAANNAANALRQQQGQKVEVADVTKEVYGNNYVGAKPSYGTTSKSTSGSADNVTAWTDEQQSIKDQMNQNSQAWHNATSQEEKDRLHAENQQLAGQLGGNVSFNPGSGTWSGSASNEQQEQPSLVNDYSNYLEEMYAANRKAALAAINNAYQQNINAIDRAGEGVDTRYQNARNQAAGSAELAARNFAEYAAAYGLGSGTSGQAELARNITLQNNLNDLTAEEAGIYADLELQKSNAEVEYNNAIAEAEANNDSQLAAALYQEKIRVQNALIEEQARLFEQNLAERQFQFQQQQAQTSNDQWQQAFDYQKQQDQMTYENQNKSYLSAWGESMLENGFMPTEEMLAAMGLTSDQAQAYIDFYKQMVANTTKYSSGSSGGASSNKVSNNTNNNVPPAPSNEEANTNKSYSPGTNEASLSDLDTASVLALGIGPVDFSTVEKLVEQGKLQMYQSGSKIGVKWSNGYNANNYNTNSSAMNGHILSSNNLWTSLYR